MGWDDALRHGMHVVAEAIKRMNQVVVAFPVWLVVGIAGVLKRDDRTDGWQDSEPSTDYRRRY